MTKTTGKSRRLPSGDQKKRIHPTRIVEVIEDPLKLNGVGVTESDKNIDKIEEYGLKRNDKMILDFGNPQSRNI